MFGKVKVGSSIALLLCTVATFWSYGRVRPEDALKYQTLVEESAHLHSKDAFENHPAHQLREQVQKDIWTMREGQRTHFRLKSEGSELTFRQTKGKLEATEHLNNLEACFQGKTLGYFTAKEGTYFFPSHTFLAEGVELFFYRDKNEELPAVRPTETPFWQGKATRVAFNTANRASPLSAEHVQGAFASMHCEAEEMSWLREESKVLFRKKVLLQQEQLMVEAEEALVTYQNEYSPEVILLTGNVHLISALIQGKESFAIADALTYRPQEKLFVLESKSPKKVLFWQDGTRLSAERVNIRRDQITQVDSIEGVGDVHCSFDLAEERAIQELLGKYL
ncbi:MAG: hypothetical protein KGJ02_07420 [Verrucomicrobiota bacterium]|nr:hypothetical protein [Verrucomicrobiota bacterium]